MMWQVLARSRAAASFALTALVAAPLASHAAPARSASSAEIQVPCGNLFGVGPPAPLRNLCNLCKALLKHPKARLFRVTWDSSGSLVRDSCTALYDRRRRTLKLVQRGFMNAAGEESLEIKQSLDEWLFEWLFLRVDDAGLRHLLRHLNRKYARNYDGEDASLGHFPRLSELGCPKRRLRHLVRHLAHSRREKL